MIWETGDTEGSIVEGTAVDFWALRSPEKSGMLSIQDYLSNRKEVKHVPPPRQLGTGNDYYPGD